MTRGALTILICAVLALPGCKDSAPIESAGGATPIEQTAGAGNEQVTLRISDSNITTAGRIAVRLTAGPDAELVEEPAFEGWTIADRKVDSLTGTWTWTLEPFLDGQYTIEPIAVRIDEIEVRTEQATINVASVLTEEDTEIAGVKGVVDPPPPDLTWLWIALGAGAVALISGGFTLAMWLRERAKRRFELRAAAHEVALARLENAARDASGGIEGMVVRVSDVVRRYIEDRYGVRAPEQTTEEFLEATRSSVRFKDEDVQLLERFLTRVDLIKFAGQSASPSQGEEATTAVRDFIRSTGSSEVRVVVDPEELAHLNGLAVERVLIEDGGGR